MSQASPEPETEHSPPPTALPTPRGAHLEMIGAVLAGEGLERVAWIAAEHAGAPVAVVVPRVGKRVAAWADYERYVAARLAGSYPQRPVEIVAEVAIASGGQELGAVLMLGPGARRAGEYLHVAAVAALTEVAVNEARDETEQSLRASFLEELLTDDGLAPDEIIAGGRRLGCDLSGGAAAVCIEPPARARGRVLAAVATERPLALAQAVGGRVYALVPGSTDDAQRLARRLGSEAISGVSAHYKRPGDLRRAMHEAALVLEVKRTGGAAQGNGIGDGTYRLVSRVLARHPDDVRGLYRGTVAPIVAHDEQYDVDLVATLETYLGNDCDPLTTARKLNIQRHTVSYRLERVRELTGLDPSSPEDRERLSLGLKAYRIVAPGLPR